MEVTMKKVFAGLLLGFLFLVPASRDSYAGTSGPAGATWRGFPGEDMPMPPMRNHVMGVMEAGHPMWKHLMDLGLDEKQKEAIKEIKSRVTKDIIGKRADLEVADVELRDILDKDPVDLNVAEAKLKKIESLLTDIRLFHLKAREEVKAKLTSEQRRKFKEAQEKGPVIGEMMHGGWRMPPPAPE